MDSERLNNYLNVKWCILGSAAALTTGTFIFGVITTQNFLTTIIALAVAGLLALLLQFLIRTNRATLFLAHFFLALDLIFILLVNYREGHLENPWIFFPALQIFTVGFVFSFSAAMAYAAAAFAGVLGIFLLEYYHFIPHFPIYFQQLYWTNPQFCIDALTGMFFAYFLSGLGSSYLSQIALCSTEQAKKTLADVQSLQKDSENSRKAMLNIMEDLGKAKDELEVRVKERTAQLENIKTNLERIVSERTARLENSQRAILHMMKDLKEDVAKLQSIDRMKTEFLSMVSHELRTPLTPIQGYLSLLKSNKFGALTDAQKNGLEVIERQSKHLNDMIDSLLDLSRVQVGKPLNIIKEPVLFKKIVEDTVQAVQIQAAEFNISLSSECPPDLPTIMGDETKLKRVLSNLIGNAIKFTPKGGKIKVRTHNQEASIRIEISDDGIGIAPENLTKVFEKFFQVDSSSTRSAGGMGMGLPIAKELVELHGGKIWAESAGLGNGSTFIFTLPIA